MPEPFLIDTDYRALRMPQSEKIVPVLVSFGEDTITLHLHERGVPDDVPLDVLQDAVTGLFGDRQADHA